MASASKANLLPEVAWPCAEVKALCACVMHVAEESLMKMKSHQVIDFL